MERLLKGFGRMASRMDLGESCIAMGITTRGLGGITKLMVKGTMSTWTARSTSATGSEMSNTATVLKPGLMGRSTRASTITE